eukprot:15469398-Alexandrium_andersonii.AAC.1
MASRMARWLQEAAPDFRNRLPAQFEGQPKMRLRALAVCGWAERWRSRCDRSARTPDKRQRGAC